MSNPTNRRRVPRISEYMTSNPCTTEHDLSVKDAQERMFMNKIRHLLVLKDGALAGIVSTRDLDVLAMSKGFNPVKTMVSSVMISKPFTCAPDAALDEVAAKMEDGRFGAAVVVEGKKPVGIFTTIDALRALRQMVAGVEVAALHPAQHEAKKAGERTAGPHRARASANVRVGKAKTFSPS